MSDNNKYTIPLCDRLEQHYAKEAVDLTNQINDKDRKGRKAQEVISGFPESEISLHYNGTSLGKRIRGIFFKVIVSTAFVGIAYFGLSSYFENGKLQTEYQNLEESYQQIQELNSTLSSKKKDLFDQKCETELQLQQSFEQRSSLQTRLNQAEESIAVLEQDREKQEENIKSKQEEIDSHKQKMSEIEVFLTSVMAGYIEKHKTYRANIPFENFCEQFIGEVFHTQPKGLVRTLIDKIIKESMKRKDGETIEETIARWNSYEGAKIKVSLGDGG